VAILLVLVTDTVAEESGIPLPEQAVILAVTVNGLAGDNGAVFLQDNAGKLYASATFLANWNLKPGTSPATAESSELSQNPSSYYDLTSLAGLSYEWNHETAELLISASPDAFLTNRVSMGSEAVSKAAPYTTGASLSYDLSTLHTDDDRNTSGQFDVAMFRGYGLFTGKIIADNEGVTRLLSTWETDKVDVIKTLRIGDSFNHTGSWGRGVLFGGIQYGTNFSVRPDFVPFATPGVTGKVLLPSTVDVYVNQVLRSRQEINAGPFSIQNLPVISGAGEVELVIKDVLGREQLITQPFYASPVLLRKGLVDQAYELGWQRENYGLTSNDYHDPFVTATWRQGLSGRFTGEGRVELQRRIVTAGVSIASKVTGENSVVESSLAISSADDLSTGLLAKIGFAYQGRRWSTSAHIQFNNTDFRQLGTDSARLPKQFATAQFSRELWNGTLAVNYLRNLVQGESMSRLLAISYSRNISNSMFLNFSLTRPLSGSDNSGTAASLGLTLLFDSTHTASAMVDNRQQQTTLYADVQRATPQKAGTGYRLAASKSPVLLREEASVTRVQSFASLNADVVKLDNQLSTRLGVQGGIATLGDGVFLSRELDRGFAIVQTRDLPGVPVYVENQMVGRTNRNGHLVVNNLRDYEQNHISIDAATLPLEASVGEIEQIVVPRSHGGVLVDFAVNKVRSVILTILQTDDTPLPPWTPVEVSGVSQIFVTGRRGEVFIDLPEQTGIHIIARPEGHPACELRIDQPAPGVIAPYLEPQTCIPLQ